MESSKLKQIKNKILEVCSVGMKSLSKIGLFHVFGSYTINRVIAFITNTVIVRLLSKEEFGVFGSAYNVYSLFIILNGFGMINAVLLYCSEERGEQEKRSLYRYTLKWGFFSAVLLSAGMLLYGFYGRVGIQESSRYIIALSVLPLFDYVQQYILVFYRIRCDNKTFARLLTINTCAHFLFDCAGALMWGVGGTIAGRYLAYIVTIAVGTLVGKETFKRAGKSTGLPATQKRDIWNYALKSGSASALNQIVYLIDIALISYLVSDAMVVASYKTAAMIPEALSFIPQSVIVTVLPYFARKQQDGEWVKDKSKKLFIGMAAMNFLISLFLWIMAPFIIEILWGEKYLDSVPYFRILSISYFFLGTFRLFSTNLLAIFHRVTFNFSISLLTGVSNILLDYFMVKKYGAIGAAWATLFTVVIASLCSFPYLIYVIKRKDSS